MGYFGIFSSNTTAASANQLFFTKCSHCTGRVFYKITHGGQYRYSLLFSGIIDSTYADGSVSSKNTVCDDWRIERAAVATCKGDIFDGDITDRDIAKALNDAVSDFVPLTFDGDAAKKATVGLFCSDPLTLTFESGDYLCVELTFSGSRVPYHEESLLPIYVKTGDGWIYDRRVPLPCMIGCDRMVDKRIGFIGDSITQGVGTPLNSYTHWNALLSRMLGDSNAYWNLGIGFGRADDIASLGVWSDKAKENDILFVCFGVNDILQGFSAKEIIDDLTTIVSFLKANDKTVILQTVPPFDYGDAHAAIWRQVNDHIKTVLSKSVDLVFDTVPVLCGRREQDAAFGGHPNEEGCARWATALYEAVSGIL